MFLGLREKNKRVGHWDSGTNLRRRTEILENGIRMDYNFCKTYNRKLCLDTSECMKSTAIVFLIAVWLMTGGPSVPGSGTPSWVAMQKAVANEPGISASVIKGIQVFGESSGIAYTAEALYRTDDNGEIWHEIPLPKAVQESVSGVSFVNEKIGWAILTNWTERSLYLAKTQDGGHSWTKAQIDLPDEYLAEADLNDIDAVASYRDYRPYGSGWLKLRLASSSNFIRQALFETSDGGHSWKMVRASMDKKSDAEFNEKVNDENIVGTYYFNNNRWFLTSKGNCEGFKTGCVQETNIYIRNKEITPPRVKELARLEKEKAKRAIGTTQMFALAARRIDTDKPEPRVSTSAPTALSRRCRRGGTSRISLTRISISAAGTVHVRKRLRRRGLIRFRRWAGG